MSDGLEGVVAAETVLSHSDGEQGFVWVRGHPIGEFGGSRQLPFGENSRKNRVLNMPDSLFEFNRRLGNYHTQADCG